MWEYLHSIYISIEQRATYKRLALRSDGVLW